MSLYAMWLIWSGMWADALGIPRATGRQMPDPAAKGTNSQGNLDNNAP